MSKCEYMRIHLSVLLITAEVFLRINPSMEYPAVEIVFTMLHAGKFGGGGYKVSGGLHGVGASVVNALSEWMIVKVRTEGKEYQMKFQRGETVSPLEEIGEADNTGSYIHFKPDSQIFEEINFNYDVLKNRLREMAFLNKGLKITLEDRREEKQHDEFCYEGGIVSFVEYLNRNRTALHSKPIYIAGKKKMPSWKWLFNTMNHMWRIFLVSPIIFPLLREEATW